MAFPSIAERLLYSGNRGSVEYAVRSDGTMEAKEWLDSQPATKQMSFGVLFQRLAEQGFIHNEQQFRRLRDEVWEFKRGADRLLCFHLGSRWLLTHRIKKSGGLGKCPPHEIGHAKTIGNEHVALEAKENNLKKKGGK